MSKLIRLFQDMLRWLLDVHPSANETEKTRVQPRLSTVWDDNGVVVVQFHDFDAVPDCETYKIRSLVADLFPLARQNPAKVVLDFGGQDFIPSDEVEGMLVRVHSRLDEKLRMCNLSPMLAEHFAANGMTRLFHTYASVEEAIAAHIEGPVEMAEMDIQYFCANCNQKFVIHVTDDEMRTSLESTHLETCPNCGQQAGWGPFVCNCGEHFQVRLPHWHVGCDLANVNCPKCGKKFISACIC